MGLTVSQQQNILNPALSKENKASLEQVLNAFKKEFSFIVRDDHRPTSKTELSQKQKPEEEKLIKTALCRHRSRSLDERNPHVHKPTSRNSSMIKRQWQCQLCKTVHKIDSELCLACGSSKINVYIPILNHHQNAPFTQNSTVTFRHPNPTNGNGVKDESIYRRSVLITHKLQCDEHIVLKHVEKLRNNLIILNSQFQDETFPASLESLYISGNSLSTTTLALLPQQQTSLTPNNPIQWLRPDQIHPYEGSQNQTNQWTVFRHPKPNDVLQGALGDCWFITALSVLAEKPEYLMKVFITKEYNYQGIYCVRLCKDGEWTQVLVDDRLPCTLNKRLAYSQTRRKQLWVPLIEKALAKLNGSYEAIIAGRCCEGLATVTGSPCETLILGDRNNPDDKNVNLEKLWMKLFRAHQQRFLMCAMCSNNTINKQEFEHYGLFNNHAYSVQNVKQSNDGKHRLIKLRNPWGGTYRWIGDWSDDSPLWAQNPDLRQELLKEKRSTRDGVFWMPFTSFVKYFECVDICKIRSDWYEVRDSSNFYPEQGMMQAYFLRIQTETQLDITLHRKISKNLRIQRSEVSLCVAIVNIEDQSNGNYRIFSIPFLSQRGQHKFVSTDAYLRPGTYVILPFLFNPVNKQMDNTEFNIAVHSSSAIDLERFKIPLKIEREFFIKLCLFYGDQVYTAGKTKNELDDKVTIYELKKYWDGIILLVENRNPNKNVHFRFRCSLSQNAWMSRKDSHHQLYDVIPPMHRQIIVTIARKNASHSFTIGHDFQYNLSSQSFIKNSHVDKQKHWPAIDESISSNDIHLPQSISIAKQQ